MSPAPAESKRTVGQLIAHLNGLAVGDLDLLKTRLAEAIGTARELGNDEIVAYLDEGLAALGAGDLRTFRKRVATAIARLGHLR